jgi:hypothetical protein
MSHITYITYAEYQADKDLMRIEDQAVLASFPQPSGDDIEQMVATLKGMFPADLTSAFDELAKDRGVAGMAHDLRHQ